MYPQQEYVVVRVFQEMKGEMQRLFNIPILQHCHQWNASNRGKKCLIVDLKLVLGVCQQEVNLFALVQPVGETCGLQVLDPS